VCDIFFKLLLLFYPELRIFIGAFYNPNHSRVSLLFRLIALLLIEWEFNVFLLYLLVFCKKLMVLVCHVCCLWLVSWKLLF